MFDRFELDPRTGILFATVLIIAVGGTRIWFGWDNVSLWRDLPLFLAFGIGAAMALALLVSAIWDACAARTEAMPAVDPSSIIDLKPEQISVAQPSRLPRTGSSEE